MHILYSNCVSILTYASEVKEFTKRDFMTCNTSVNNAIRKIFSYKHYESIRTLREQFGYLSRTNYLRNLKKDFTIPYQIPPTLSYVNCAKLYVSS